MSFRKLGLSVGLPLTYGLNSALVLIAALVGLWGLYHAMSEFDRVLRGGVEEERLVRAMQADFQQQVQEWKDVLIRGKDPQALEKHWSAFVAKEGEVDADQKRLAARLGGSEAGRLVEQFGEAHRKMGEGYRAALERFKAADFQAQAGDAAVKGMDRAPVSLLDQAAARIGAASSAAMKEAHDNGESAGQMSLALMLAMSAVGVAIGLFMSRVLVRATFGGKPEVAVDAARAIAQGDLTTVLTTQPGDTESLMAALKDMQDQLTRITASVAEASRSVAAASNEIAQGNAELSSRTEEQASALEETSSAVEELNATVQTSTVNAAEMNRLAHGASEVATQGGAVVGEVVTTMQGIEESSRRIAEIINVIDGIAFQTNILALNAAVEAARAGEQGRGFAVVATEVRGLAQRSAQAAKEIKALIMASVERVENGGRLVKTAGQTMEEVVQSIKRVSDMMGEMNAVAQEQGAGIQHIAQAVAQIDHSTQQNAALVEESAAAAESLREQADRLVGLVSVFRVSRDATEDGPAPGRRGPASVSALPVRRPSPAAWRTARPAVAASR